MLCSIDLFLDWGNLSGLTSVILLIDFGEPYRLTVGSRTYLVNLVTGVAFKLVLVSFFELL